MTNEKITPLSEKIEPQGNPTWDFKDGFVPVEDVKQTLKNFCEEEVSLLSDLLEKRITWGEFDFKREQLLLKHFGELA